MKLQIRFFGEYRELAGTDALEITAPPGASVSDVLRQIESDFPKLRTLKGRTLIAVNEEYVTADTLLSNGDTLAVFPPVSGGSSEDLFQITSESIETRRLVEDLLRNQDGAVVAFEGVVRDHSMKKRVLYLEYEAYESMALRMLQQIGQEVHERWPIGRIGIIHRLGRLDIGETSVAIVVTSAHRRPAFEACHYAIDRLKKIVPIWKREYFEDGAVWVEGDCCAEPELPPSH